MEALCLVTSAAEAPCLVTSAVEAPCLVTSLVEEPCLVSLQCSLLNSLVGVSAGCRSPILDPIAGR